MRKGFIKDSKVLKGLLIVLPLLSASIEAVEAAGNNKPNVSAPKKLSKQNRLKQRQVKKSLAGQKGTRKQKAIRKAVGDLRVRKHKVKVAKKRLAHRIKARAAARRHKIVHNRRVHKAKVRLTRAQMRKLLTKQRFAALRGQQVPAPIPQANRNAGQGGNGGNGGINNNGANQANQAAAQQAAGAPLPPAQGFNAWKQQKAQQPGGNNQANLGGNQQNNFVPNQPVPIVVPAALIPDDQLFIPRGAADQPQPAVNQLGIENQFAQNFVQTLLLQDQELQTFIQGLTKEQALVFGAVFERIYLNPGEDFRAIMGKNIKNQLLQTTFLDVVDTLEPAQQDQVGEMIRKIHDAVNRNGVVPPARPALDDLFQAPSSNSSSSSSEEDSSQQEFSFSLGDLNNATQALSHLNALEEDVDFDLDNDNVRFDLSGSSSSEEDSSEQELSFSLDYLNNAAQTLSRLNALEEDVDFDLDNDNFSFNSTSSNSSEEDFDFSLDDFSLVDPKNVKESLNLLSNSDDDEDNTDNSSPGKPQKRVDLDREDDTVIRIRNALRNARDLDIDE